MYYFYDIINKNNDRLFTFGGLWSIIRVINVFTFFVSGKDSQLYAEFGFAGMFMGEQ